MKDDELENEISNIKKASDSGTMSLADGLRCMEMRIVLRERQKQGRKKKN